MILTTEMFEKARTLYGTDGWKDWLTAASMVTSKDAKDIEAEMATRLEAIASDEAIVKLTADCAKLKMSKAITDIAKMAAAHKMFLSITIGEDGEAKATIAKMRAPKPTDGTISPNSRIAAPTALRRGIRAGDTINIVKVDGGFKDGDRFIPAKANGGLAGYLVRVYPDSHTAKLLIAHGTKV